MKTTVLFFFLILAVVKGFVPVFLPSATPTTTTINTELNALGLRTTGRFIKRKILRRQPKESNNNGEAMEVVMKEDQQAKVEDGAPVMVAENEQEQEEKPTQDQQQSSTDDEETTLLSTLSQETEQKLASMVEAATLVKNVDTLFEQGNPEDAKELLLIQFSRGIDTEKSGPLYWRLVKAQYELYSVTNDPETQKECLEKGLELIDTVCPSILENDVSRTTQAYLWKWKAILLGKLGNFQSTKEKMANSFLIKDNLEQAQSILTRESKPDASIYQALGEWCFKVSNISFLERQAASVLFGKPPKSTYKEALEYFQKGYDLKATPTLATKMAATYQRMGDTKKAEEWFAKANEVVKA